MRHLIIPATEKVSVDDLDDEERRIKQEEIDLEFAASFVGSGQVTDPIDLTLSDWAIEYFTICTTIHLICSVC